MLVLMGPFQFVTFSGSGMKWHVQNHWAVTRPGFLILCPEPPASPSVLMVLLLTVALEV